jgi:hypothetical protein
VFKDLDIVGIVEKPNESSIQACTDHLKGVVFAIGPPQEAFEFKRPCFLGLCGGGLFTFLLDFVFVVLGGFLLCACVVRATVLLLLECWCYCCWQGWPSFFL